jgi:serine/threonine protein kinase
MRVGRYQIVRRLAIGGMAELYLGYTRGMHGFEKLVCLKRILPHYAENPEFVRMFLDEARLAATLEHSNIAHVYDIGQHQGSYFFAMEYVHGRSLAEVMRAVTVARKPLPLEYSLQIVIGTCAGLHYAHERVGLDGTPLGIVHRDVSPPNIIITYDGLVKVVDFGIAKAATARSSTDVGTLKGKVPYMSPEQCRSEVADRRSDIFSIGILLYELSVGRRLFAAETEIAIMRKIVTGGFPPPTSIHANYPPELEAIVMRALQLHAAHRWPTARDLQLELEEFALDYRLALSSARLATFMEDLFDAETRKWPTNPNIITGDATASFRRPATPVPSSAPSRPGPPFRSDDMQAFDDALSRMLSDDDESPPQIRSGKDELGIDLDNLELEDLVPAKFNK